MSQKIICAMSGGVDSSVAAALLMQQGFDVIGVFMRFSRKKTHENTCCSVESYEQAKQVARKLGIKLYVLDFSEQFSKEIISSFIEKYKSGLTPNPCVICNEKIKFGLLFEKAKKLGIEIIATGHYAKIENNKLYRANDSKKDQSYFLYRLNPKQLNNIVLPLGELKKPEVRKLAEEFGFSVATKKDSQEVCFVPNDDVAGFLKNFLKEQMKQGPIMNLDSEIIGEHKGLPAYTIGQRKGIEIGGIGPFYVVRKDMQQNILYVTKNQKDLLSDKGFLGRINWLISDVKFPFKCESQIRYQAKPVKTEVSESGGVEFSVPQRAVTSGQSLVFYKNKQILGGGIIK